MKLYVEMVKRHMRTCDESNTSVPLVPLKYRAKTLEMLNAIGLDANGDKIPQAE